MKRTKEHLARLRHFSPILNPTMRNDRNHITIVEHDSNNLRNNIAKIEGSPDTPGEYWNPQKDKYEEAVLPVLKEEREELEGQFKRWQQTEVNNGNQPTEKWPVDLAEKREKQDAMIQVMEEELELLKKWLVVAEKNDEAMKPEKEKGLLRRRENWGTGVLKNGVLVSIAGQEVGMGEDGILEITDEDSPYLGMPVWRFKSEVAGPMHAEYRFLCRAEDKAALKENRPKVKIIFPAAPKYDQKTGEITYPGYSENTLKKLEKS